MRWTRLLSRWRSLLPRPRHAPTGRCRPQLEVLEGRQLLSTFTVVLPTDGGGAGGQKVTATSGDLRYCIEQADASHTAGSDTIAFSPKVFATPQTITLNATLTLSDGHPLTIKGPAGGTVTVSGGDQVGVLDVTGGTVALSNLDIIDGHAQSGGGILNTGTVTLTNCTLSHNAATSDGGGIFNTGTVTLTNCTLSHNAATSDGGGICNIGTATLTNCTLSNNTASSNGGGICNTGTATLTNCTLSNNTASNSGGGIDNRSNNGTVRLTNCTLSNNTATYGGGIANGGTVSVTNSTFSNNAATKVGGGIFNLLGGPVTLTNCTLSDNAANLSGGGIYNEGTVTLTNCTLSNNTATNGGGIFNGGGTLNLTNTLVAENTASTGPDIDGPVQTADHDLIGNGSGITSFPNGSSGSLVGTSSSPIDPRLGPLQNNGGPTQTLALLPGSPAIGQADNTKAPKTDQRGKLRLDKHGETTDIGAFEV